jgi:hypothetical protein
MPATEDPGGDILFHGASVRLEDLRLFGEAVNALRVGADALAGAAAHFAGAARDLGEQTGDAGFASRYDRAFGRTQQTVGAVHDTWERLARDLDAVADAYAESGGPSITAPGGP